MNANGFHDVRVRLGAFPAQTDKVSIDGMVLQGLREIKISAHYESVTEVTVVFVANVEGEINGKQYELIKREGNHATRTDD